MSNRHQILDDVIITGELDRRPSRPADFAAENRALALLAETMASSPDSVLSRLVELIKDLTHAETAGISLLEPGMEQGAFRWVAIAGTWGPYQDGMMRRDASPCGEVVAREAVLLMKEPERAFPELLQAQPGIAEGLLAPFFIDGVPVGTVWVVKHDTEGRFEAEDARILKSLAKFASAAHQMTLALKGARTTLGESEARFRQFGDASTNVLWIRDAETLRMTFASAAFETIYGRACAPDQGSDLRCWAKIIVPEDRKRVLDNIRLVRAGERIEHEFQIRRVSDGALRWVHNTDFPIKDSQGRIRWIAGVGMDMTAAKRATERQDILVAELQHRTRNLIAVVRSLADRTLDTSASLEVFGTRFGQRLAALSRVQGLLSHLASGERVMFDELLRSELSAHGAADGDKVTLDGPANVPLRSGSVQTLALALHELCTNAVKYGALKGPNGHLSVRWHVAAQSKSPFRLLHIEWRESGVAMPAAGETQPRSGFGRELIEQALPYQLQAKTSYRLGADGVRCTIAIEVSNNGGNGSGET